MLHTSVGKDVLDPIERESPFSLFFNVPQSLQKKKKLFSFMYTIFHLAIWLILQFFKGIVVGGYFLKKGKKKNEELH